MPQKTFKKDGVIYDMHGSPLTQISDDSSKHFAVIVRCGHCGNGNFIPIMFPVYCKDIAAAVDLVRTFPRVKRDQRNAIIDAFEITNLECMYLNAINDRDPYLRGFFDKTSPEIEERVVYHEPKAKAILNQYEGYSENILKRAVRTSDSFGDSQILQRYYAPRLEGGRLIYPKKVNQRQMLDDYMTQITLDHGVKKKNVFYMTIYYQIYGKNNPLGLVYDPVGWFTFKTKSGRMHTFGIDEQYHQFLKQSDVVARDRLAMQQEAEDKKAEEIAKAKMPSAIDRFNRRMANHKAKTEPTGSQPGDE